MAEKKRRVWAQLSESAFKEALNCSGEQSLPEWIEHAILIHIERTKIQKSMRSITQALREGKSGCARKRANTK